MGRFRHIAVILVLNIALVGPVLGAKLSKELGKREVVMWENTELGMGLKDMPFSELKDKISKVAEKPCELVFGRTILSNPSSGFIGVITGALGVRVAMQHDVDPEEGGMEQAFFTEPAERKDWQQWINYLENSSSTEGGKDLTTALLLRRKARILKFQLWIEEATGRYYQQIAEEHLNGIREDVHFRWLANDIFEPVTVILKPELAKLLYKNRTDTGPAFGPIPTLNLISKDEVEGNFQSVQGCIVDKNGRFIVRRTDSVVLLSDIKGMLLIDDTISRDSLGDIVGHELFHGINERYDGNERSWWCQVSEQDGARCSRGIR